MKKIMLAVVATMIAATIFICNPRHVSAAEISVRNCMGEEVRTLEQGEEYTMVIRCLDDGWDYSAITVFGDFVTNKKKVTLSFFISNNAFFADEDFDLSDTAKTRVRMKKGLRLQLVQNSMRVVKGGIEFTVTPTKEKLSEVQSAKLARNKESVTLEIRHY